MESLPPKLSRRWLLSGIVLGASVPILAACGASSASTTSSATSVASPSATSVSAHTQSASSRAIQTVSSAKAATTAAGKKVTLQFAYWGSLQENKIWEQVATAFMKVNPSIQVKNQYVTGNYNQKLTVEIAGGNPPDVINQESKYLSSFSAWFRPLDSYVAKSSVVKKSDFFPTYWERGFWAGKQLGIPWDSATSQIFYNVDVFKEAGVPLPPATWDDKNWTWDSFLSTAQKLTKGTGAAEQFGYIPDGWWVYLQPWIWANGGVGVVNHWDNPTVCTLNEPKVKEAINWVVELRRKWHVAPLPGQMSQGFQAALSTNKVGMWENNTSSVPALMANKKLNWNVAPYPQGGAGAWVRDPVDQTGMAAGSKHPDESFKLIEYITGVEGEKLITSLGRGIPSRIAIANSNVFLRPDSPIHWKVFYEAALKHVKQQPLTPVFDWIDRTIGQAYSSLVAGHMSIDQFVNTLTPEITAKLKGATQSSGSGGNKSGGY